MGGCRENPMPSPENYIVIKLGESEVCIRETIELNFSVNFKISFHSSISNLSIGAC